MRRVCSDLDYFLFAVCCVYFYSSCRIPRGGKKSSSSLLIGQAFFVGGNPKKGLTPKLGVTPTSVATTQKREVGFYSCIVNTILQTECKFIYYANVLTRKRAINCTKCQTKCAKTRAKHNVRTTCQFMMEILKTVLQKKKKILTVVTKEFCPMHAFLVVGAFFKSSFYCHS